MRSALRGAVSALAAAVGVPRAPLPDGPPPMFMRDDCYVTPDGTFTALFRLKPWFRDGLSNTFDTSALHGHTPPPAAFEHVHVWNALRPGMRMSVYRVASADTGEIAAQHRELTSNGHPAAVHLMAEQSDAVLAMKPLVDHLIIAISWQPRIRHHGRGAGHPVIGYPSGCLVSERVAANYQEARRQFEEALSPIVGTLELARHAGTRLRTEALADFARRWLGAAAGDEHVPAWMIGRGWFHLAGRYVGALHIKLPQHDPSGRHTADALALQQAAYALAVPSTVVLSGVMLRPVGRELEQEWQQAQARPRPTGSAHPLSPGASDAERFRYLAQQVPPFAFLRGRAVIMAEADSEFALETALAAVGSALESHGVQASAWSRTMDGDAVAQQYLAAAPWALIEDAGLRDTSSYVLANAFPATAPFGGGSRPCALAVTSLGRLYAHDTWSHHLLNGHKLVIGRSGSGKALIVQRLDILPALARGDTQVLVLESGGSYTALCEAVGGVVYMPQPGHGTAAAVFARPTDIASRTKHERDDLESGLLDSGCETICAMVRAQQKAVDEPRVVHEIAHIVMAAVRLTATRGWPTLAHVHAELISPENADTLLARLAPGESTERPRLVDLIERVASAMRPYCTTLDGVRGAYAGYFEGDRIEFTATAPMIVVDLRNVKHLTALEPVLHTAILSGAWYRALAARDGRQRIAVYDDLWAIFAGCDAATSLSPLAQSAVRMWREGRKFGVAAIGLTQAPADIKLPGAAQILFENSAEVYLTSLPPGVGPALADSSAAPERHVEQQLAAFASLRFGREDLVPLAAGQGAGTLRALVRSGASVAGASALNIPERGLSHWVMTTNLQELKLFRQYEEQYVSAGASDFAIRALLAADYPLGSETPGAVPRPFRDGLAFLQHFRV